ncbi:MAG: acetyltransferase [Casimicrobiaceae bacterium]
MHFDVFNGDADGLCALHQLRLSDPRDATLVTGAKRDIRLLNRVSAVAGDTITVLDIALAANAASLVALLQTGISVEYFDHHFAGAIPVHPALVTHIDTAPEVCTGVIVDRVLQGRHRPWAIAAAFGDTLHHTANKLADTLNMPAQARKTVREVGEALAYNAYGDCEADLIIHPAALYAKIRPYADPLVFAAEQGIVARITATMASDLAEARDAARQIAVGGHVAILLPDAAWSRRVRAAIGNELAAQFPERAHAVVVPAGPDALTVSVRAPVSRPYGAAALCARFPEGGGREAAAGINHLPSTSFDAFLATFAAAFPR